jgi:NAD(P)-dependent dehydrogenase (short-subunit alcohol dehydrogenase family)
MADRITTPFNATSTAAEVIAGIDLTGRRTIVTGGASGIGIETARALASAGAEVVLAVRNVEAGKLSARNGVAAYALDPEAASRLWQVSVETLAS